jgi:hypothetical protein
MDDILYNQIQTGLDTNNWGGVDDTTFREFLAERKHRMGYDAKVYDSCELTTATGGRNATKCRQFTVCQFNYNPRTGDFIADLSAIVRNLERYKSFTEWSWAIHDEDTYTQDAIDEMNNTLRKEAEKLGLKDEAAIYRYIGQNVWAKLGDKKGVHLHIVVKMTYALEIWKIADWLGVPEFLVKMVKGKGALLDCTQYLTHEKETEQALGKHLYDDSAVHTSESFKDWRERLDARAIQEAKYGKGKTPVQKYVIDVLKYGKTLLQCKHEMDPNDYMDNLPKLQKARQEYLMSAELPNTRITFYVYGDGGIGKGIACELLARGLCPQLEDIEDIIFPIGSDNATFDGYDGQPVVIWQEMRAADFMSNQGRRTTLVALEPHPRRGDGCVNVKYGKTKLINAFNIINGIDKYDVFIKALAGEYKDKNGVEHHAETKNLEQFYRRFPVIIPISEQMFDILINSGVFNGTREYEQYASYASMVGSFARLQQMCGNNQPLLIDMSKPLVDPMIQVSEELRKRLDTPEMTEAEIRAEAARLGYGTRINGDGTTDEQTQQEYNEFVQRWQQLNPDKSVNCVASLKEWVINGKHTHYDEQSKTWYRPEAQQTSLFDNEVIENERKVKDCTAD